ncbi:Phosphoglycerate kinase [subsurface metagenome]
MYPLDFGVDDEGKRGEILVDELPVEKQIIDIGPKTINKYEKIIEKAGTIFVNGPPGIYEREIGAYGTKELWRIIGEAKGYSVIGGGDTVASATRLGNLSKISYVCTGGGALIRFLSGIKLPLVEAMEKACERWAYMATTL